MNPLIISSFRKSSYSDQQGDCVEVARTAGEGRAVRDSKIPDGGVQYFSSAAWCVFVGAVKVSAGAGSRRG
ncbi:DUF397 domain-containing protein [Streptomyces sp. NPDC048629]|uniref:DUF397 domain-containing protein n=1 Tax=Streptomyces sp. NPDC048629 TaxID=3154824 RepID=UPI003440CAD2